MCTRILRRGNCRAALKPVEDGERHRERAAAAGAAADRDGNSAALPVDERAARIAADDRGGRLDHRDQIVPVRIVEHLARRHLFRAAARIAERVHDVARGRAVRSLQIRQADADDADMRDVGVCIERVDADLALAAVRHFRNETRHAVDQMAAGDGVAVCGEHHAAAHAEQVAARIIARQFEHRRAAFLEDLVRRKHIFRLLARADLDLLPQARHRHARQDGGRFAAADGIVRLEPAAVRAGQHAGTVEQIDRVRVLCRGGNIRDRAVRDAVDRLERAARERPGQHGRKFTAARVRVIICKRPGQNAVAARVVDVGLIPR